MARVGYLLTDLLFIAAVQPYRIVECRRFVRASGNRSAEAWRVESVSPVPPVSDVARVKTVSGQSCDAEAYARASRGE